MPRSVARFLRPLTLIAALAAVPAQARDTGYVFVSSEKDHAVTVLDGKTLSVVKVIPTGKRPRDMRLSPDRSKLYVIASDSQRVDVIDIAKLAVTGNIPVGEDPEMFDLSADGKRLYVSNEEDAAVSVVDIAARKRLTTIAVGEEPEGVKVSPDGKRIYVTSEVANMVHVVDAASHKILANVVVGNRPRRFATTARPCGASAPSCRRARGWPGPAFACGRRRRSRWRCACTPRRVGRPRRCCRCATRATAFTRAGWSSPRA